MVKTALPSLFTEEAFGVYNTDEKQTPTFPVKPEEQTKSKKRKEKEVDSSKLYYSISEVSAMFGVNASLLRFWEKEFDIIKPRKNAKGNRLFTQQDIDHIALIYHYVKERRLTLEGARQKIKENPNDTDYNFQIVQSLKNIRAMLLEIKKNIGE
jgi:DNA-binding transcriptional MerR regulator